MATSAKKSRQNVENDSDDGENYDFSDEEGGLTVDGIYIPPPPQPYCSLENKGPRLIITHITNDFFKSYAGERVLGPFHQCFNAIVGPNGSGKSNVIDSMLFVFGYRASKIRSKKISVLLHNSEKYPNVQSCTVTVHFAEIIDKEGDEYDVVPGSVFNISRTANKDNSSYYTLNGKKTQFKEIGQLLKKHGIDLDHNRFLILQGEVEQISLMSPKGTDSDPGMLEYLEDIIGTTRYKVPLAKLDLRVEELSEQRCEKLNRLKLVQTELDELKAPMEEAVKFLKLENTIVTKKNFYYQKQIFDLEQKVVSLDSDKEKVDADMTEVNDKLKAVSEQKAEKASEFKESATKKEGLEKRLQGLKDAFNKANNKDIKTKAEMTEINKQRKKTIELLSQEKKKLESYKKVPADTEEKVKFLEKQGQKLSPKMEALEEQKIELLASIRDDTKELQEKKEVLQTELADLNKIVNEDKSAFKLAESELKLYMSNQENETKKYENLRKACGTAESKMSSQGDELRKLEQMIPQAEKEIGKATKELQVLKTREVGLVGEVRKKRSNLEEVRSNMQQTRSRGRVLDSLMQQKLEGRCPGLFGRLGDLGAIDPKYDVAVSTACGPLDNIVVDTIDTAQWCIEFLKQHNIGRATIIALEKQEHFRHQCNKKIQTPENVPRLFDLIRVEDPTILPAFYYAVRDTLVADNLDQGSRIAYGAQRYRVVTLGGHLIETTGTMSGGGKRVSRGRMGQSVTTTNVNPKDIENMEVDVHKLEDDLRDLRQHQSALETSITELTPQLRQMKITSEKFTIELSSLKQQQPRLAAQLKEQEQKMKSIKVDAGKVKELTKVENEAKVKYEEALGNSEELQKKVDVITEEINVKSRGKIKKLDDELKQTKKAIEKGKSDITKLTVGLKTAERNAVQAERNIESMGQEVANAETQLRNMKVLRDEIEEDAKQLLTSIEEISERVKDDEDSSELYAAIEKLQKVEKKLKGEAIEVEEKLKRVNEKLKDVRAKIYDWRLKITQLKLQDIPDATVEPLKTYIQEELEARNLHSVQKELHCYEEEYKAAKPNLNAITEYSKKQVVFIDRSKDLDEVSEKRKKMRGYYDKLCERRKDEFTTGYNIIKMKLKEMYQMITLGGDADFEMLDSFDPFNEGILFRVRPPKKTWKLITNLSGGEKTLSSLALVFALHYYKPSPLYVMDEIDAALDFKNVSIVGNYIKERTKNAQFIIISLRSNMFELGDYLIGIYKTFNCTDSITIDPRVYDKNHNEERAEHQVVVPASTVNDENEIVHASPVNDENEVVPAAPVNEENQVVPAEPINDANETTATTEMTLEPMSPENPWMELFR